MEKLEKIAFEKNEVLKLISTHMIGAGTGVVMPKNLCSFNGLANLFPTDSRKLRGFGEREMQWLTR